MTWERLVGCMALALALRFVLLRPPSKPRSKLAIDDGRFLVESRGYFLDIPLETVTEFGVESTGEQRPMFQLLVRRTAGEVLQVPLDVASAAEAQFIAERANSILSSERRPLEAGYRDGSFLHRSRAEGSAPAEWTEDAGAEVWQAKLPPSSRDSRWALMFVIKLAAIIVSLLLAEMALRDHHWPSLRMMVGALGIFVILVVVGALRGVLTAKNPATFSIGQAGLCAQVDKDVYAADIATVVGVSVEGTQLCLERENAPIVRVPLDLDSIDEARFVASRVRAVLEEERGRIPGPR